MIQSNRFTTGLNGFDAVQSVYNIPDVDPDYKAGNLHYANVPNNATQFETTSLFYDPNRPIGPTNQPPNPSTGERQEPVDGENRPLWERLVFDPWNLFGNDGQEADQKPIDNATVKSDDKFAVGVLGLVFVGFVIARVIK